MRSLLTTVLFTLIPQVMSGAFNSMQQAQKDHEKEKEVAKKKKERAEKKGEIIEEEKDPDAGKIMRVTDFTAENAPWLQERKKKIKNLLEMAAGKNMKVQPVLKRLRIDCEQVVADGVMNIGALESYLISKIRLWQFYRRGRGHTMKRKGQIQGNWVGSDENSTIRVTSDDQNVYLTCRAIVHSRRHQRSSVDKLLKTWPHTRPKGYYRYLLGNYLDKNKVKDFLEVKGDGVSGDLFNTDHYPYRKDFMKDPGKVGVLRFVYKTPPPPLESMPGPWNENYNKDETLSSMQSRGIDDKYFIPGLCVMAFFLAVAWAGLILKKFQRLNEPTCPAPFLFATV